MEGHGIAALMRLRSRCRYSCSSSTASSICIKLDSHFFVWPTKNPVTLPFYIFLYFFKIKFPFVIWTKFSAHVLKLGDQKSLKKKKIISCNWLLTRGQSGYITIMRCYDTMTWSTLIRRLCFCQSNNCHRYVQQLWRPGCSLSESESQCACINI